MINIIIIFVYKNKIILLKADKFSYKSSRNEINTFNHHRNFHFSMLVKLRTIRLHIKKSL